MERLAVKAWPALETADVEGWLWRWSGGGSQRANSVSTIAFTGVDVEAAIAEVEARYHGKGQAPRFQIYEATSPSDLHGRLLARGYVISEACTTLWKPIDRAARRPASTLVSDQPDEAWFEVYLSAQSASRQIVNRSIVPRAPAPRAFVACTRDGRVISTGLGVVDGPHAVIECMATRSEARRQGGAIAVLQAIEAWALEHGAESIFLQTTVDNAPAQTLYRGFGMTLAGRYCFAMRNSD